jgi:hypothetical protein
MMRVAVTRAGLAAESDRDAAEALVSRAGAFDDAGLDDNRRRTCWHEEVVALVAAVG